MVNLENWKAPEIREDMPHGDMPGDEIAIGEDHIKKAQKIFPELVKLIEKKGSDKIVVSVFGGSGVGKSEIASLLAFYLQEAGIGAYVMSGDNYPKRIPLYNDAERLSRFRSEGLKALVKNGLYSDSVRSALSELWAEETDPDPSRISAHPWLETYQKAGRLALKSYLGTEKEQDYEQVNEIISTFKSGGNPIFLKRMGRTEDERWYDPVDFTDIKVLIIEWTHGGNERLRGIDIPILLNSTPEETREHRRNRARDGKTDSAFTTMVLEIEQEELDARRPSASIVISKAGEFLDR